MQQNLDEIHQELLAQLRDITRVCHAHQIEYTLMCGSLLGAVRHQGFIPWDDDIDLLMLREDFQRFREIYPREGDPRFTLTYLNTWTPRVMNRDEAKAAAFTDFFILDSLPEGKFRRRMRLLTLRLLQGMLKRNVDYSRFNLKNKVLLFITHLMGLPFTTRWKTRMYERVSTATPGGDDLHMSNGAFGLLTQVWHREQFSPKVMVDFDGVPCTIPEHYHPILVTLFGEDYMTPPPESERVAKHLDL